MLDNRKVTQNVDRRLFLKGAGTVAVALPFATDWGSGKAEAAPGDPPPRLVTLFFGLGLDPVWQAQGFAGPLEPYEPLQDKIAFFTNVNMEQGAGGAHCENSPVVFVGERNVNENRSGGASLDQIVRQALAPTSTTLASGLWWRRGACDAQALRVWNPDGTARPPLKRPTEVFDRLFGSFVPHAPPGQEPDPERVRDLHTRRSILDTVLSQYQTLSSPGSRLSAASRQKLELHLQSIREIELQLAPAEEIMNTPGDVTCEVPVAPDDPDIDVDYDKFTYGTGDGSPVVHYEDFQMVFRLHADLWVAGLRCGAVQFGNLMFESAGGHTNFSGTYTAMGESTDFPDDSQHDSYFHDNKPLHARLYQHFAQTNLAYFLSRLDSEIEDGDRSLLDNTTIVIGTEYGKNHSSTGVFHAICGGRGRFNPGFYTQRLNAIDVYNAVLTGHGLPASIGGATNVDSEGDASSALA